MAYYTYIHTWHEWPYKYVHTLYVGTYALSVTELYNGAYNADVYSFV